MASVDVCGECRGRGKYKVYNAYDLKFEEEVICEYCAGWNTDSSSLGAVLGRQVEEGLPN